jgi:TatD DNase family protein
MAEPTRARRADKEVPPPLPDPLPGMVLDAHCHFESMARRAGLPADAAFVAQQMSLARSVGVGWVVNVGCEVDEWQAALASTAHPDVYAALAVHPTEVSGLTDEDYDRLAELLLDPRVVAVGETGLDYYWDRVSPAEQQLHFRRHIELAKQVGKPLMIHDRDAHADVLRILQEQGTPEAGVIFHAFSGNAEMARHCVEAGYILSFPGVLTFTNAPVLRDAAAVVPLTQTLVETDAPFLTPHPFRGRPNAPYLIPLVVQALSRLKSTDENEVCATITATARRIFGVTRA